MFWVVKNNSLEVLKLLLSHPSLTALTLNHRCAISYLKKPQNMKYDGASPVMLAVIENRLKQLALLAADPRVDLDTTDKEGRSLEERAR